MVDRAVVLASRWFVSSWKGKGAKTDMCVCGLYLCVCSRWRSDPTSTLIPPGSDPSKVTLGM